MADVIICKTRETPVRWKADIPGYILTAGINNTFTLRLQNKTNTGYEVPMASGKLYITLRRIPSIHEKVIDFGYINVPEDSTEVEASLFIPESFKRGYYRLHIIHELEGGVKDGVYNAWVVVDQTTDPRPDNHMEITSIRAQFADICGEDNKMLDGLEIGVGDIGEAVERCLQQWEATAPRTSKYTGDNFPYAELLRNGVLYMILQSICTLLDRNVLQYQAEGVSINTEARSAFYKALKQEYSALWRAGMMQMKNEENVNCFIGNLYY